MKLLSFNLRTIGHRLLLMLTGIAFFSSLTTAAVLYINETISIKHDQIEKLSVISDVLAPNLAAALMFNDEDSTKELISPLVGKASIVAAHVTDTQGNVVASISSDTRLDADENHAAYNEVQIQLHFDNINLGALRVIADSHYIQQRREFYISFIIVLLLFNTACCLVAAYFLTNRFTLPILNLANVARRVSSTGDYSIRATAISNDEVADLTDHFNEMLEKIESRDMYLENQVANRTKAIAEANKQLEQQALYDTLTELPNRRYFYKKLAELTENNKVADRHFTVFFIDLDGFKEVNDTLGHDQGDLLLKDVAARLQGCVRQTDFVARLGGDEFTVILQGLDRLPVINEIAQIILDSLSKPFQHKHEVMFISGSIGITQYPTDGEDIEKLIKNADQAMYAAKHDGRNCFYHFSNQLENSLQAKKALSDELRRAVARNEFMLFYQPIIELSTGRIAKFEALLRWNHPDKGIVMPDEFIHTTEELGIISDINERMMPIALEQIALWRTTFDETLQLSLNASPAQFRRNAGWIKNYADAIKNIDLPTHAVVFEITESLAINFDNEIKDQLYELQSLGMQLAIDDFGTGYSSLSHLQKLDVNILKIDKCFVQNIQTNPNDFAMCRAIIDMAHQLQLQVVAEGVESIHHQEMLRDANCDFVQGFYYSEPVDAISASALLEEYLAKPPHQPIAPK